MTYIRDSIKNVGILVAVSLKMWILCSPIPELQKFDVLNPFGISLWLMRDMMRLFNITFYLWASSNLRLVCQVSAPNVIFTQCVFSIDGQHKSQGVVQQGQYPVIDFVSCRPHGE